MLQVSYVGEEAAEKADPRSRFMPNIGKYMLNVLNDKSNGAEKDKAWAWKTEAVRDHVDPKLGAFAPTRELRDLEGSIGSAKL